MGLNMRQWGERILKAEDLKNGPRKEQIALVRPPSERDKFPKPVVVCESGLVVKLNPTSVGNLMAEFGHDADDWLGKFIECRRVSGMIDNVEREWIEVEPVEAITPGQRPKAKPTAAAKPGEPFVDDEVPFA
jgi:hypothetical protein